MARRVEVRLVDDRDGVEAAETICFGLDGVAYEIDLSVSNAAELREELAPFVAAARRPGRRKRSGSGRPTDFEGRERIRDRFQAIRAWAREQGLAVASRGRIRADIVAAYDQRDRSDTGAVNQEGGETAARSVEPGQSTGRDGVVPVFSSR